MSISWAYNNAPLFSTQTSLAIDAQECTTAASLPSPSEFFCGLAKKLCGRTATDSGKQVEGRGVTQLPSSDLVTEISENLARIGSKLESTYRYIANKTDTEEGRKIALKHMSNFDCNAQAIAVNVDSIISMEEQTIPEHTLRVINDSTKLILNDIEEKKVKEAPAPKSPSSTSLPKPIAHFLTNAARALAGAVKDTIWANTLGTISQFIMTSAWLSGLGMSFAAFLPETILGAALGLSTAGVGLLGIAMFNIVAPMATHFNNELWEAL